MTRPLRIEFPGALYHVTARGDRREPIYLDEHDRYVWLDALGTACKRFNFVVHAFCQMTNHYHLLLETVEGNLGQGMRQLNSTYSQALNRRHRLVGHVLQGRYKSILVQKETYLLALSRYVVLNPVRAGVVATPAAWPWSNYPYLMQAEEKPPWLETDWLLSRFGSDRTIARRNYQDFVMGGCDAPSPLRDVQHRLLLGDEGFVEEHLHTLEPLDLSDVVRAQRQLAALSLAQFMARYPSRNEAMARAYGSKAYSMREIAQHFAVSQRTVSRAVKQYER
jgi:putative transposase